MQLPAYRDTGGKESLTQQVHCGYIVGSGAICPHYTQWVHGEYFMKEPINSPTKNPSKWPLGTLWKKPMGSFIKYPEICPQCTQWVFFKELTTNPQFDSVFPQTLKEPTGFMAGYIVDKFLGILWKNPWVSFTKNSLLYPLGFLWANWWVLS